MICFISVGRLGNQLFQYAFLKSIQKNREKVITIGFDDLEKVFDMNGITNISQGSRWRNFFFRRICKSILLYLSDRGVISSIFVDKEVLEGGYIREVTSFSRKKGFFSGFCFVKQGFFQSECFFNKEDILHLQIKKKFEDRALSFLKPVPQKMHKIFVHIRRGDYKDFMILGKSTLLPLEYFRQQINYLASHKENVFFIFLSDDSEFIKKEFSDIQNKLVSDNNHCGVDLAIMRQCDSAILSPSSFGWWGSYFMRNPSVVIAPRYWLGFNSKIEVPFGCVRKSMYRASVDTHEL